LIDKKILYRRFVEFITLLREKFSYNIQSELPSKLPVKSWKIPIKVENWNSPVAFRHNNTEFIGVGDTLGLAHPIIAAGIEPAWQSGWLLGESLDVARHKIDKDFYRHLLKKNLQLTSRKPIDIIMANMLRLNLFPYKDQVSYMFLKVMHRLIIKNIKKYPWFAMVHDGKQKTGFSI
jgi:hypothetical protein